MPREKQFDEEEVIKKLTQTFWKKGYRACSVGDLVEASGLSRSSLYDTFGDKEKLFARCLETYGATLKESLHEAARDKTGALEKIRAVLLMPFRTVTEGECQGCLTVNTMGELDNTGNEIQELVKSTKAGWEEFLIRCIKEGQRDGEISTTASSKVVAGMIYTFFCGLLVIQRVTAEPKTLVKQIDLMLQLLKAQA